MNNQLSSTQSGKFEIKLLNGGRLMKFHCIWLQSLILTIIVREDAKSINLCQNQWSNC